jgi:hypothetical protein
MSTGFIGKCTSQILQNQDEKKFKGIKATFDKFFYRLIPFSTVKVVTLIKKALVIGFILLSISYTYLLTE